MQTETLSCSKVPTVDLGELGVNFAEDPSQHEWQRVTHEIEQALSQNGCAYLTHHGVSEELINEVFSSGAAFFRLDADAKVSLMQQKFIRHYVPSDSERYGGKDPELREGFIFKPGNCGLPDKEASHFMTTETPFHQLMHALSRRLLITLALSLDKNRNYFLNMHLDSGTEKGTSMYCMNIYPGNSGGREDVMGLGAHRDFDTFTLLFSNDSKGLQIRDSDGQWIDVPFVPDTLLLMAGEFLHFYSEKRFTPPMHRVVLPSEQETGCPSHCTLVYFVLPDGHHLMWPPSDDPASPKPPSVKDYLTARYRETRNAAEKS